MPCVPALPRRNNTQDELRRPEQPVRTAAAPAAPQGQPGYGYPQQAPQGIPPQGQPGYGYPQQPGQPPYGAMPPAPGTLQANNGYINVAGLGTVEVATMGRRFGARLIDGLVIGVLYSILSAIGVASAFGASKSIKDCTGMDYASSAYQSCVNEQAQAAAA
ncbi:hypothetical protein ACFSNO_27825 [Streptomyces cirratus]